MRFVTFVRVKTSSLDSIKLNFQIFILALIRHLHQGPEDELTVECISITYTSP
jgi:hypothetical protein